MNIIRLLFLSIFFSLFSIVIKLFTFGAFLSLQFVCKCVCNTFPWLTNLCPWRFKTCNHNIRLNTFLNVWDSGRFNWFNYNWRLYILRLGHRLSRLGHRLSRLYIVSGLLCKWISYSFALVSLRCSNFNINIFDVLSCCSFQFHLC